MPPKNEINRALVAKKNEINRALVAKNLEKKGNTIMAITIPVNNIPMTPLINMEEYRIRVADYAVELWNQMLKAERVKSAQKDIKYHSSARISSLRLSGGKRVSANIDESEAIYLEKYADSLH